MAEHPFPSQPRVLLQISAIAAVVVGACIAIGIAIGELVLHVG